VFIFLCRWKRSFEEQVFIYILWCRHLADCESRYSLSQNRRSNSSSTFPWLTCTRTEGTTSTLNRNNWLAYTRIEGAMCCWASAHSRIAVSMSWKLWITTSLTQYRSGGYTLAGSLTLFYRNPRNDMLSSVHLCIEVSVSCRLNHDILFT
jgi:hypothetical protein